MNRIQTRALVEGAVFASITVVIGIIRFYVPIVALISIFWSIPAILIAFRHGFKVSIYSVVVSSALVAVMTQPIEGLGFFIGFGIPGIFMGYLLKKNVSAGKTVFTTGIILAICSVVSIYLGMLVVGTDIAQAYDKMFIDMKSAYSDAINSIADAYSKIGVSRENVLKGAEIFEKSLDLMKLILPGGILLSGIMMSFMNFKLTRLVLKRINYTIEDVKPFSLWKLTNKWMAFVISILLLTIVELNLIKLPQLYALTMNISAITSMLFIVLGLSVTKFYLDKYSVPRVLKGILMLILLIAFGNVTLFIGILDIPFDFRKLRNKTSGEV